ncbi:MAG: AraC family ligand binding domain-containing protein [Coprobacillaceae bacterium]
MIPNIILEKIVSFTEEEINNLNGKKVIDNSIFIENSNIIDYHKILKSNDHISIRKHARFAEYPKHKHNYIELMYVYSGKMTHSINGEEITVKRGEMLLLNQNIEHSIKFANENDIIFNFIIPPTFLEFLSSMIKEQIELSCFIFDAIYSYNNKGEYLVFKVSEDEKIRMQIEEIIINIYKPPYQNELVLKLLVGVIVS